MVAVFVSLRVEAFNHENSDLKKKVESLESNNRSLLGQLQKLQALVSKVPRTAAASATQTGTVLMVSVLLSPPSPPCFGSPPSLCGTGEPLYKHKLGHAHIHTDGGGCCDRVSLE